MPVIISREKQVRKTNKKRGRNRQGKSQLKTTTKQFYAAIEANDQELALEKRNLSFQLLDRSITAGTHKKNFVSRRKSALSTAYNQLAG